MKYIYGQKVTRFRRKLTSLIASVAILANSTGVALPIFLSQKASAAPMAAVYDALPSTSPSTNYASYGMQAHSIGEYGDMVTLAGTNRIVEDVTVTMSNWAKKSQNEGWCSSNPSKCSDAGFIHPITISIYDESKNLITSETQDSFIPWRPESDPSCGATSNGNGWLEEGSCVNVSGLAANVTVDFDGTTVLPNTVLVAVSYPVQSDRKLPGLGVAGPYNSLNFAFPQNNTPSTGTDDPSTSYAAASWTDGYNGGLSEFTTNPGYGTVAFRINASVPAPMLNAENFNTVNGNYRGMSVGFNANNFGTVSAVSVELERADGSTVTKHGNQGVFDIISGKTTPQQLTAPFVIEGGTFTEASDTFYWDPAPATWDTTTTPVKATITVTDENGPVTVETTNFTEGSPSWPTYESLLPPPANIVEVYGNTSADENQPGWMFNRDPGNVTPYEFTITEKTLGNGSIFIAPIGSNPSDKFVAELFEKTPIGELDSFSYDFKIAGNGTAADEDDFYLNVYANVTNDNKYYDCRFDYVPTTGSNTAFTTAKFFSTSTPTHVQQSGSARTTCPATLAEMPAGSYVRAFVINVGQSTASDQGLAGYLDNAVITTDTTRTAYDFEYTPDPTNSHQLNVSGTVYRDIALNDCDNMGECLNRGEVLSGWDMRLYKEVAGSWQLVQSKMSDTNGEFKFSTQYEAGIYHICEVSKDGWTQSAQTWSGSGYKVDTPNLSGNSSENPWCNTINYDDTGDRSSKSNIGNVDTGKPTGNISYFGGTTLGGVVYLNTINDLTFEGDFEDNHALERTAYVVWKVDSEFKNRVVYCGNWPASSSTHASLTGTSDTIAGAVKDCGPTKEWEEGYYEIGHRVYDTTGNFTGLNSPTQKFVIDQTGPTAPTITTPTNEQSFNSTPILNSWTSVSDPMGVAGYQIAYAYDDGHSFGGSTCPGEVIGGITISGCRDTTSTQRNHVPGIIEQGGVTIWVRAIDGLGNTGAWSAPAHYYYDATPPAAPTISMSESDGDVIISGFTNSYSVITSWPAVAGADGYQYQYSNSVPGDAYNAPNYYEVLGASTSIAGVFNRGEGLHHVRVRAYDSAGNWSGWSNTLNIVFDATNPVVTSDLVSGSVLSGSVTMNQFIDDANPDRCKLRIFLPDNSAMPYASTEVPYPGCSFTLDTTTLADGAYVAKFTGWDKAGNAVVLNVPFSVDNTAPVVTINPLVASTNTTPVVTGTIDDPAAVVKLSIDGGPSNEVVNNGDGTWTYTVATPLAPGAHTFTASAADAIGNITNPEPTVSYTVNAPQAVAGVSTDTPNSNASGNSGSNPSSPAFRNAAARGNTGGNGSVLAAETDDPSNEDLNRDEAQSEVNEARTLAAGDENNESSDNSNSACGKFVGICWYWWIPIAIAVLGTIYYLTSRRADEK